MFHLNYFKREVGVGDGEMFVKKVSGRYYTGEPAGKELARRIAIAYYLSHPEARAISAIDPFGGDGRLLEWLIEAWTELGYPRVSWNASIWDIDNVGFEAARTRLSNVALKTGAEIELNYLIVDAFSEALSRASSFDIVLTNPPWVLLKPDRRELEVLSHDHQTGYIDQMRAYDKWLAIHYPLSQPRRKFAGWGTNLSRVGLEASLSLVKEGGLVGVVLPASILADDQTARLREHLFTQHSIMSVAYYPAEIKLYDKADVASVTLALEAFVEPSKSLTVTTIQDSAKGENGESKFPIDLDTLRKIDFVVPIAFGTRLLAIQNSLAQHFPRWGDLESSIDGSLWAGRELDETGIEKWLIPGAGDVPLFIKGRMIGRYRTVETPTRTVARPGGPTPISTTQLRIVWRDVSRPSQKRRLIASLAKPGWIAGNSLGVAYFRDGDVISLLALLGVMNSLTFEFQLRAHLATGHVSLSSLRKVSIPPLDRLRKERVLAGLVQAALLAEDEEACLVDAYVAKNLYSLTEDEYSTILASFPKIEADEIIRYLDAYRNLGHLVNIAFDSESFKPLQELVTLPSAA